MALEQSNPRVNINPQLVVAPRDRAVTSAPAVQALSDAFAKGFITSEDILARVGPRAHQQAQVQDLIVQQKREELEDPDQALAKQAMSAQNQQLLQLAVQYGAPLPQNEQGKVDFGQLRSMAPQLYALEQEDRRKASLRAELEDAFKTARSSPSLNDIFIPSRGNAPVTPQEFNQLRDYAASPTRFGDLFGTSGAPAPAAGTPQVQARLDVPPSQRPGGVATPGGQIVGSGTPIQPVARQAAPAPQVVSRAAAPSATFFPSAAGSGKAPTELQSKAYMAKARFDQAEPVLEAIENSGYQLTGTMEAARRGVASARWVPEWLPLIGYGSLPPEAQQFITAAKQWSQGLLRLESGAAITPAEEKSYVQTFLPRAGEPQSVVLLKRDMRRQMADTVANVAAKVDEAEAAGRTDEANALRRDYVNTREDLMAKTQLRTAELLDEEGIDEDEIGTQLPEYLTQDIRPADAGPNAAVNPNVDDVTGLPLNWTPQVQSNAGGRLTDLNLDEEPPAVRRNTNINVQRR